MQTIREYFKFDKTKGDVGVEIEMEGATRFPVERSELPRIWAAEYDGSLRGHSVEYVTRGPVGVNTVSKHLNSLAASLKDFGARVNKSFRAGVHIHVNVQEMNFTEVGNMAAIYYCLEKPLVKFCGSSREGNHFCLRTEDAEYPIEVLKEALKRGRPQMLSTDRLRYASLNLSSLAKYGSLEFRAMETQPDLSKINSWAKMLVNIRAAAVSMESRTDIAYQMSNLGPENWAKTVLGEEFYQRIAYNGIEEDILSSMRNVQTLIHLKDKPSGGKKEDITTKVEGIRLDEVFSTGAGRIGATPTNIRFFN